VTGGETLQLGAVDGLETPAATGPKAGLKKVQSADHSYQIIRGEVLFSKKV
jgi:TRAP-type C4-dicarboxylate transport system substrate-binding protein